MKQEEFKRLYKSVGVNVKWLSEELRVPLSVAQSWVDGKEPPTKRALGRLRRLDNFLSENSNRIIKQIVASSPANVLKMVRYSSDEDLWAFHPDYKNERLPVTVHHALIDRIRKKMSMTGVRVDSVDMDRERYFKWLGGRKESSEMRTAWALAQGRQIASGDVQDALRQREPHSAGREKKTWKLKLNEERTAIFAMFEPITGAEHKALRQSLGLTLDCAAFMSGVTVDTVKKWESGKIEVEDGARYALHLLNKSIDEMAASIFAEVIKNAANNGISLEILQISLPAYCSDAMLMLFSSEEDYIPAKTHNLAAERARKLLRDAGYDAKIVTLRRSEYKNWLGRKPDTGETRTEWLKTKIGNLTLDVPNEFVQLSPEEFKALRESVGLTVEGLAQLGDVEPSEILAWESGKKPILGEAKATLLQMEKRLEREVDGIRKLLAEKKNAGNGEHFLSMPRFKSDEDYWAYYPQDLYIPVTHYYEMLNRIEKVLLEVGVMPVFYPYDHEQYLRWLGARENTHEMLVAWSNLQVVSIPGSVSKS